MGRCFVDEWMLQMDGVGGERKTRAVVQFFFDLTMLMRDHDDVVLATSNILRLCVHIVL